MEFLILKESTLIESLGTFFPDCSKTTLQKWIKWEKVAIDEKIVTRSSEKVIQGQKLSIVEKNKIISFKGIEILYEDRYFIVINKPIGILSIPDHSRQADVISILRQYYQTESIAAVHRIDRETSGLMVVARGKASASAFDELFEKYNIHRNYLAIVEGNLKSDKGTWQSHLLELDNFKVITHPKGKLAVTHYEVYRRSAQFSYLNLTLETGRKHQIRVHCREAGHPVLGDKRYGSLINPAKRLCLHSYRLGFTHPFTKKTMAFEAPIPKNFITLGAHLCNG